jgi:hypothetical protein
MDVIVSVGTISQVGGSEFSGVGGRLFAVAATAVIIISAIVFICLFVKESG